MSVIIGIGLVGAVAGILGFVVGYLVGFAERRVIAQMARDGLAAREREKGG